MVDEQDDEFIEELMILYEAENDHAEVERRKQERDARRKR